MTENQTPEYDRRFRGSRHYVDENGPILRESFLAFIDMLGSKALIRNLDTPGLRRIMAILGDVGPMLTSFDLPGPNFALLGFTDNIVLATPVDEKYDTAGGMSKLEMLIKNVGIFQYLLMMEGIAVRGGIVRGPVFLADHFGTGQAIVDAYHLESTTAIVPRVILSDELSAHCRKRLTAHSFLSDRVSTSRDFAGHVGLERRIAVDRSDSRVFVSYLYAPEWGERSWEDARLHQLLLRRRLDEPQSERVRTKYEWLAKYHNFVFSHTPTYQIAGIGGDDQFEWLV